MKQSNKITSYFKVSSKYSKMNGDDKPKESIAKNDIKTDNGYDSDCFIIDEKSAIKDRTSIENNENQENSFTNYTSTEQQKEIFPENDFNESLLTVTHEDYDCHIVNTTVNSNIEEAQKIFKNNYSTDFFVQMVNNFLSNPELHYLFDADELKIFQSFINLTSPVMKTLFVRMYWLQWRWHKVSDVVTKYLHLDYRIPTARNVVSFLEKEGFLLNGSQMTLNDWLSVLTLTQLNKLYKHIPKGCEKGDPNRRVSRTKANFTSIFEKVCSSSVDISKSFGKGTILSVKDKLIKKMNILFGSCIKIDPAAKSAFDVLHTLMYMGTNPQILREKRLNLLLLTVHNGQQHYPAMDLECDSPKCIYPTRLHFLEYVRAQLLAEEILKLTSTPKCNHDMVIDICRKCYQHYKCVSESNEFKNWLPPPWLHRFTPGYQYLKAMEMSLPSFKASRSEGLYEEALDILTVLLDQTTFRQHKRALWYSEQTLIMHIKLKRFKQAAEVLILALNEPDMTEDEKAPLRDRAIRLAAQKNTRIDSDVISLLLSVPKRVCPFILSIHITARVTQDSAPGKKAKYYFDDPITGDRTYTSVEDYALLHYMRKKDYTDGDHWEGRIITSIFVLLFWDIIYSTVEKGKGLFLSPYQEMPLDMHTPHFYENRKGLIDERLKYIKNFGVEDILDKMKDTLKSRKKGDFSLLSDKIEWEHLSMVVQCLSSDGLHSICKRLSQMYHYTHSGFPDLTLWNSQTKKIKFVEVKGDGDKLSFKQIQWVHYLIESNIDTEVCYVHKNVHSMIKHKLSQPSQVNVEANTTAIVEGTKTKVSECIVISDTPENHFISAAPLCTDVSSTKTNDRNPTCSSNNREDKYLSKMPVSPPSSDVEILSQTPPRKSVKEESPQSVSPGNIDSVAKRKLEYSSDGSSSQSEGVYLRSPNKLSKGVGYFVSPCKSPRFLANSDNSPKKYSNKRKLSLSLTRRRLLDVDK